MKKPTLQTFDVDVSFDGWVAIPYGPWILVGQIDPTEESDEVGICTCFVQISGLLPVQDGRGNAGMTAFRTFELLDCAIGFPAGFETVVTLHKFTPGSSYSNLSRQPKRNREWLRSALMTSVKAARARESGLVT